MVEKRFFIPRRTDRLAPCQALDCGHPSCERLRTIAGSPCLLCRKAIGYGVNVLDERSDAQQENDIYYVGFSHYDCRRRWKHRYTPAPQPPASWPTRARPALPTPVHLNDE